MLKFYGAAICSTCRDMKQKLEEKGIEYEYIDITANIKNLRAFLALRDTLPAYESIKAEGRVGIPTFVWDDGTVSLDTDWLETPVGSFGCADC